MGTTPTERIAAPVVAGKNSLLYFVSVSIDLNISSNIIHKLESFTGALLDTATSEWITVIAGRAPVDGATVTGFAKSVDTANAVVANVDTSAGSAVLRAGTFVIMSTLRSASGNRIRFGKESRFTTANGNTKWADHAIRIGATGIRTARIVTWKL